MVHSILQKGEPRKRAVGKSKNLTDGMVKVYFQKTYTLAYKHITIIIRNGCYPSIFI